jgi:uncharacterized lipoprotein NlpE involved in copper resistance
MKKALISLLLTVIMLFSLVGCADKIQPANLFWRVSAKNKESRKPGKIKVFGVFDWCSRADLNRWPSA